MNYRINNYFGFGDSYILFNIYLLLRTVKTTIKRYLKNLRLFLTTEESINRLRINIFSEYINSILY